jgi:hypothetical protein
MVIRFWSIHVKKNKLIVIALLLSMGTEVSWAGHKWQSQNPDPSEKPPVSSNPTNCNGNSKDTHTWCRTGKDDKALIEARSAQRPPSGGAGIRFGGVRSEYLKYSSLKSSGDRSVEKKH